MLTVFEPCAGTVTENFAPFDHLPLTVTVLSESLWIVEETTALPSALALDFSGPGFDTLRPEDDLEDVFVLETALTVVAERVWVLSATVTPALSTTTRMLTEPELPLRSGFRDNDHTLSL